MFLHQEITSSFAAGMNDSAAATAYRRDEAALILNGRISPEGAVEVRGGSQKLHAAALNSGAQGYGAHVFQPASGSLQWVAFVGDSAYYSDDQGASWSAITGATGLGTSYWSTVTMRVGSTNYLLCANGGASAYKYDGTTWSAIANIPANVKYLAVFNDRLYAGGHAGSTVVASKIGDFETWAIPDGLSVQVQTHDGDQAITGLYQIGNMLLVFKRNSVSYIQGYGNSDLVVGAGVTGISRSVGCLAPRSLQGAGDQGVLWLSGRGIEMYVPGREIQLVSGRLRGFFDTISWADIAATYELPTALYFPRRHEYWLALPSGVSQNNYTVVVQTLTGALSLFKHGDTTAYTVYVDEDGYLQFVTDTSRQQVRTVQGDLTINSGTEAGLYVELDGDGYLGLSTIAHDNAVLFTADRDEDNDAPHGIGYDGFVRALDTGTLDNVGSDGSGGSTIGFRLRTRPLLFGRAMQRKHARKVHLLGTCDSAATVTVGLLANGEEVSTHDVTLPAASGGQPRHAHARVKGKGRILQIELRTTSAVAFAEIACEAALLEGSL